MKSSILLAVLCVYVLSLVAIGYLAAMIFSSPRVNHSKDKNCNTLPVQCVEPVHR